MINLLPKEDRLKLNHEYRRRLLLTWGGVVLMVVISFLILETSFYLVLWRKRQFLEKGLALVAADAKSAQFDELEAALSETAGEVAVILTPRLAAPLTTLIKEVVTREVRVAGIVLGEMTFDFVAEEGTLNLRGIASTRQGFLDLVKVLSESDLIETVDYPVNNLINEKNIRFALQIKLNTPQVKP